MAYSYNLHTIALEQNNNAVNKEIRLQRIVNEISDYAIYLLDEKGLIESWNKGAEKLKGYTEKEILGKHISTFYPTGTSAVAYSLIDAAKNNGRAVDEGWRVRKDGSLFWASITITSIHNDDGQVIGFTKVTKDMTEMKSFTEKLHASEERFQKMVHEVQDYAIILLDTNGKVVNWNLGAQKIKGYTEEEVIGKHFRMFYSTEDQFSRLPEQLIYAARMNGRSTHEGWRLRKDGTRFWGYVVITSLHDDLGNVTGFSKVTKDNTEHKEAEEVKTRYIENLENRSSEMEQLAYIAAHDLQEPLRSITSFIDLLDENLAGQLDEESSMYMRVIRESAERMRTLVKALLNYALIGTERIFAQVDCNETVQHILKDLTVAIQESHATVNVQNLPIVNGDKTELRILFQNIIANAIKFRKEGVDPVIDISCTEHDDSWEFCIKDNGIGINKKFYDKIFQIFQRLHPQSEYGGIGIGLSYVKKITETHNGKIWLTSAQDEGTSFYFTISKNK